MVTENRGLRDIVQGIGNELLLWVVRWIIARRGVEFLYWCDVPAWEKYLQENPSYDPQNEQHAKG